ncbi:neuronal acetylcholine receptor subunit alpha-6 [Plakobranchus ocellatus]|uniref:Neuronal acetylcholine receptor subunit alpha-6 n=1 Tax=Plakobranchus ocellatus TaxID=259542 RepID=A0AAV3ZZB1_9GAST|nr:neuronal acetylcholine receptor subunit alpha-6 [Plakobranchus ocellatus]
MLDLSAIDESTIPLQATNTGELIWQPPSIITIGCSTDPTFYPFDTQRCDIEVTSFGYGAKDVSIYSESGVMTTFYTTNGEWDLIRTDTTASNITDQTGISYSRVVLSRFTEFIISDTKGHLNFCSAQDIF